MHTADAGTHSEANLAALAALEVTALIADPDMRQRDERFADREHHTTAPDPLHDKSGTAKQSLPLFASSDFTYDADARTCVSGTIADTVTETIAETATETIAETAAKSSTAVTAKLCAGVNRGPDAGR